ncbi:unnamed protein product [Clonostachys rosea]|uniref:Protein kinase domain-containing protein n=1 Tax=Bionectria ochroleuca TaxID=29856 RepID=A0ABY6UL52_BIOOC|nr:unnamed protein product [Clonostachys rosea]
MYSTLQSRAPYQIRGWKAGDDEFLINIQVNGYLFVIPVSVGSFTSSPKELERFKAIHSMIAAGGNDSPEVWDYAQEVTNLFMSDFATLAPLPMNTYKTTLAELESRMSFECKYQVAHETLSNVAVLPRTKGECASSDDFAPQVEWDMRQLQSTFPLFSSQEVEIHCSEEDSVHDVTPHKVLVENTTYFYKPCFSAYDAIREVDKYCKITMSDPFQDTIRTSKLFGVVVNDDGQAKGLLYHWIQTAQADSLTGAIENDASPPSVARKQKWVFQIRRTLEGLHRIGATWGDVKSDNVLIDEEDNAVVIGLGGGTTRGWVERGLGGTVEGDLQGLERLMEFVSNGDSPLRAKNRGAEDYRDMEE